MIDIPLLSPIFQYFDEFLGWFSPTFLVIVTLLSFFLIRKVISVVRFVLDYEGGIVPGIVEVVFPYIMKSSFASNKLTSESGKLLKKTVAMYAKKEVQEIDLYSLPEKGVPPAEVLERMRKYSRNFGDHCYDQGKASGSVYASKNQNHLDAFNEAFSIFSSSNPLHYDLFPALCKFEREIVRFTRSLMHGDNKVRGLVTSGGTESLMLSIKAYRDYFAEKKPWIRKPEIIAMESIHAAVDKGCHILKVKIVKVRVSRETFTATARTVEKYITKNTIAIYISAPCYPFGIIDDVEGIAKIARKHSVCLHVDSCLGGFYCPFAYRLGFGIPKFDFLVDGVTSISADTHKYGMAPKGTSVLLFKNIELRNASYYVQMKWQGGLYGTPTFGGSRSGGIIAACWAALMINGMDNYMKVTNEIHETAQEIKEGVRRIKGLKHAGDPKAMVINIMVDDSANFSIYQVLDEMSKRGWKCQGTQNPQGFHFCVTTRSSQPGKGKEFVEDLEKSVEVVRKDPKMHLKDSASLYGIAGYAPAKFLGEIGTAALSYFVDGKEEEDKEEEEEEEEIVVEDKKVK